jgi:hypothetical protein
MARSSTFIETLFLVFLLIQFSTEAAAKVTVAETLSKQPYGSFRSGDYSRYELRIVGEISPSSESIPDIDKVQQNSKGKVEYATKVTLLAPSDMSRGNGALLVDVPNRGRALSSSLFNSGRSNGLPVGSLDHGNGFLQDHGFSVAVVSWELGYGVELPKFTGADGNPVFVEAAALQIMRDVSDFFGHGSVDTAGNGNPLAGKINRILALGYSQTGRFLKSFVLQGYNRVDGHRVFDGIHILGAASGDILLRTLPGPTSGAGAIPTFENPEMRGIAEEPLAITEIVEQVNKRGEIAPRMVFVNTTTDYFSLRSSLGRSGAVGASEKTLPENVRMYDVAGASHALIAGNTQCRYPWAVLDWHPVMRSTLLALDRWVSSSTAPPPSELMALQPGTADSMVLMAPKHLAKAVVQVPALDQDGNAIGGIRLPDIAVPLGSHAVQNPPLSFLCALAGGYRAFPKTAEDKVASADTRLSLKERYKDKNDYLNRIRASALSLEKRGLLLDEDTAVILDAASAVELPK